MAQVTAKGHYFTPETLQVAPKATPTLTLKVGDVMVPLLLYGQLVPIVHKQLYLGRTGSSSFTLAPSISRDSRKTIKIPDCNCTTAAQPPPYNGYREEAGLQWNIY